MCHFRFLLILLSLAFGLLLTVSVPGQRPREGPPAPPGPAEIPRRIVSLSPGNTEILFALGAGDRIVGVASYSDYPAEAKAKPIIGSYHAPDVEAIVALAPDIVFAVGEIQDRPSRILRQAGIQIIPLEPTTMQGVLDAVETAGTMIGAAERADALCAELAALTEEARQFAATGPPQQVFVEIWDMPLLTAGKRSYINDIITLAGGVNVAAFRDVDYSPCDPETLYAYNPEVYIIVGHNRNGRNALASKPELADLAAVRAGRIYTVSDDLLARPGPRSFSGMKQIAAFLHPTGENSQQKVELP